MYSLQVHSVSTLLILARFLLSEGPGLRWAWRPGQPARAAVPRNVLTRRIQGPHPFWPLTLSSHSLVSLSLSLLPLSLALYLSSLSLSLSLSLSPSLQPSPPPRAGSISTSCRGSCSSAVVRFHHSPKTRILYAIRPQCCGEVSSSRRCLDTSIDFVGSRQAGVSSGDSEATKCTLVSLTSGLCSATNSVGQPVVRSPSFCNHPIPCLFEEYRCVEACKTSAVSRMAGTPLKQPSSLFCHARTPPFPSKLMPWAQWGTSELGRTRTESANAGREQEQAQDDARS